MEASEDMIDRLIAQKNGKRTVRQHYVPQCYLRGFSMDEKAIWAFDKRTRKSFLTSTRNIAHENGFYDLHFDLSNDPKSERFNEAQLAEAALAEIEGSFAQVLREFAAVGVCESFPDELRRNAIFHACIQRLRTRDAREQLVALDTAMHTTMAAVQHGDKFPQLLSGEARVATASEYHSLLHVEYIFNKQLWQGMGSALSGHFCFVFDFSEEGLLYASDHPVALEVHGDLPSHLGLGIASKGSEICLPLSSTRALILLEPSHHKNAAPLHLKCVQGTKRQLDHCKYLQVVCSNRWLFCQEDAFALASELIDENPGLGEERSFRVTVDHGGQESRF